MSFLRTCFTALNYCINTVSSLAQLILFSSRFDASSTFHAWSLHHLEGALPAMEVAATGEHLQGRGEEDDDDDEQRIAVDDKITKEEVRTTLFSFS